MKNRTKETIKNIIILLIFSISVGLLCVIKVADAYQTPEIGRSRAARAQMAHYANLNLKRVQRAKSEAKQSAVESFTAEISAYTAIETCGTTCTMANGQQAYYGSVACPRRIPLGTLVDIHGLGVFTCADRTAQWVDGRFDVFFGYTEADYERAKQFGSPWRTVTINYAL